MEFSQYVFMESLFLSIILGVLSCVIGRSCLKERDLRAEKKSLERAFDLIRPKDRLPSKREKRKMKWARRGISATEQELKQIIGRQIVIVIVYVALYIWICVLLNSFGAKYALPCALFVGLIDNIVIFNLAAKSWDRHTVITALVALVMIITSAYLSKIDTSVQKEKIEQHDISEMNDALVGEILYDRNDTLYKKHLPEIEKYIDEFGVDLDRLLSDYGYYFLVYDTEIWESPHYGKTWQLPESDYYWIVFTRDDSNFEKNIAIHSFGRWIECFDGDASYSMMPLTYEEPDIAVSLHEASYKVNRDVLALLMEFLEWQEKMPRLTVEEPQNI